MIRQVFSIAALGVVCGLSALTCQAQHLESSSKNLYIAHSQNSRQGKPGVRITIRLNRNGRISTVPLSYNFRSGDKVKFLFETNFDAYVQILNLGTRGDFQMLYPYPGATERVSKLENNEIPRGAWFEFDNVPGTEQLAFNFSSRPIPSPAGSPSPAQNSGNISSSSLPSSVNSVSDQDLALQALNSRTLEAGLMTGKDFNLVPDRQGDEFCAYGVASQAQVEKVVSVKINLRHR